MTDASNQIPGDTFVGRVLTEDEGWHSNAAAPGSPATPSAKNRSVAKIIGGVLASLVVVGVLGATTVSANGKVAALEAEVASLETDLDAQVAKSATAEDAVAEAEAVTAAAEAENAVAEREKAVSQTEQQIEASWLEPGTYLVPEEITAGRYRTLENVSHCYMSQDKGSDIVDNLLEEAGRPVFTVVDTPGTTFTIDPDCGTVEKLD